MKYQVVRNCYGYKNRYWSKGEVVNLDKSETPPCHFIPLENAIPEHPIKVNDSTHSFKDERKKKDKE